MNTKTAVKLLAYVGYDEEGFSPRQYNAYIAKRLQACQYLADKVAPLCKTPTVTGVNWHHGLADYLATQVGWKTSTTLQNIANEWDRLNTGGTHGT